MNDPLHLPLRKDVRLLGELLGEVLAQQSGQDHFDRVESLRQRAQQVVAGDEAARASLSTFLSQAGTDELFEVARAFSHFLNLANIAEQHHGIRLAAQEAGGKAVVSATRLLAETLASIRASGHEPEAIADVIAGMAVELVMTAHPTEVSRRTLIQKHDAIAARLADLDRCRLAGQELVDEVHQLKRLVLSAWSTDEIRAQRPTPVEEARWGFATVETSLWHAVPAALRALDQAMQQALGCRLPLSASPLRIGSWMGGDRDGNPFVTHEITREVIALARWMALDLFRRDVDVLREELSLSRCGVRLRERVGAGSREPYRDWLKQVRQRLQAAMDAVTETLAGRPAPLVTGYHDSAELLADLSLCYEDLHAIGLGELADGALLDTLRRVHCFGLPLLRLDIRQESGRHAEAMAAITRFLGLGDYLAWSEPERQTFLLAELANPRPLLPAGTALDPEVDEVLATFAMLAAQPQEALGSYVISMAHQPSDVLLVALLQQKAGLRRLMRVVPLFETFDDLQHAPAALEQLLALPAYRDLIGDHQEIMIGYSDSTKDAGFLAAAWAQYQAQEGLARVAAAQGVKLVLFHGRGGTVSRGGAPTRQALRSQPPGTVNGALRVTEQGEMIRMKFGLPEVAVGNLAQYLVATLEATLLPPPVARPGWREAMARLSTVSRQVFRQQVREDPVFIDYFRQVTPELELQLLPLGSRPAKRQVGGGVESLRAIPWVFAWTQIRLMLPAWLGVLEALETLTSEQGEEVLREMADAWPFFSGLLDMLEMVMAKSDRAMAAQYESALTQRLPQAPALQALGARLRATADRLAAWLPALSQRAPWATRNAVLAQSIRLRQPYLLPLHLLQAELMLRRRQALSAPGESTRHDHALMVTMTGISAGLRNTG